MQMKRITFLLFVLLFSTTLQAENNNSCFLNRDEVEQYIEEIIYSDAFKQANFNDDISRNSQVKVSTRLRQYLRHYKEIGNLDSAVSYLYLSKLGNPPDYNGPNQIVLSIFTFVDSDETGKDCLKYTYNQHFSDSPTAYSNIFSELGAARIDDTSIHGVNFLKLEIPCLTTPCHVDEPRTGLVNIWLLSAYNKNWISVLEASGKEITVGEFVINFSSTNVLGKSMPAVKLLNPDSRELIRAYVYDGFFFELHQEHQG